MTQMQKKYTGNEMALKTLQTYFYNIWAMDNFCFSNFFIDSVGVFFSDCNGIKNITKFPRKKGKYNMLHQI
jgi:hypothetical protein